MPVNDSHVRQIINEAIQRARDNGDACCGSIRQAWRDLKKRRDENPKPGEEPASLDLNLAAAENYMFARACVCEGFVRSSQMQTIALAYWSTKAMGLDMRTSKNPQSPPDIAVMNWGRLGAQEGALDCKRCNPKADPPGWRPVNEIMDLGNGYSGQLGRPGTRYGKPG